MYYRSGAFKGTLLCFLVHDHTNMFYSARCHKPSTLLNAKKTVQCLWMTDFIKMIFPWCRRRNSLVDVCLLLYMHSYVFNSKHRLSQKTSVHPHEYVIHSPPLCCQWSLSLWPPLYSCLSTAWCSHMGPKCWLQPVTSSSLTTFDPLQKRVSPCTQISLLFGGCAAQKAAWPCWHGY